MIVVNQISSHLFEGYQLASQAEEQLLNRWRNKLQDYYARRKKQHHSALVEYEKRKLATKRSLLTGTVYVLGGIVLSILCFLLPLLFGFSLMYWSVAGAITFGLAFILGIGIVALWRFHLGLPKPIPPADPFRSSILSPILPQWKTAIRGNLPPLVKDGDVGEREFIQRLQSVLGNSYFLLSGIQQRHGEDVDIVLVGPKGIWVFEVKYWSGTIRWRSGRWSQEKTVYKPRSIPTIETKSASQPPDKQWQRVAADVSKTIQMKSPNLMARHFGHIRIQGGLVFTHSNAKFDIAPGLPIPWGSSEKWLQILASSQLIPNWRESDSIAVLDALLMRHHEINPSQNARNLMNYGQTLVNQAEKELLSWMN